MRSDIHRSTDTALAHKRKQAARSSACRGACNTIANPFRLRLATLARIGAHNTSDWGHSGRVSSSSAAHLQGPVDVIDARCPLVPRRPPVGCHACVRGLKPGPSANPASRWEPPGGRPRRAPFDESQARGRSEGASAQRRTASD
ncbi:hypothetical protein HETIRDRAFT_100234 [Heterobasidion irregulare TC 32-1]|uniref:Uncharacterized protein n=1 Tax=Heterobasidion irregulare (strain TC 32-1) TaxID=747525 RepID=W4KMH8_HETIT|nr:uncharacterized protein HETIRDRAFT_100234 [Heterobasidion irregulare TC 32-1]ETW86256.1 hypothetical protein HETIRDRAFT_100234 [Heterobasidion irregulare TC 32-1]